MTSEQGERIVLRDSGGAYYLISSEALAGARVPDDQAAMLEKALGGDVQGYVWGYPSAQMWRIAPAIALKLTLPDPGPDDYRINPDIARIDVT